MFFVVICHKRTIHEQYGFDPDRIAQCWFVSFHYCKTCMFILGSLFLPRPHCDYFERSTNSAPVHLPLRQDRAPPRVCCGLKLRESVPATVRRRQKPQRCPERSFSSPGPRQWSSPASFVCSCCRFASFAVLSSIAISDLPATHLRIRLLFIYRNSQFLCFNLN